MKETKHPPDAGRKLNLGVDCGIKERPAAVIVSLRAGLQDDSKNGVLSCLLFLWHWNGFFTSAAVV